MGNPRKPSALKLLQGTARPSRMYAEAEYPPVTSTSPPDWLINGDAVAEWRARIGHLEAAGVLTEADLTALGVLCNMHGDAVRLWRAGKKPSAADITQYRVMLSEFGFTPASRSRPAKVDPGASASPFAHLPTRAGA